MPIKSNIDDALLFENQVCFSLYSAANAMVRAYRPELEKLDLTYLQYIVMMVLWEQDGLSVKDIGNKLRLDSGTLTPLLKRLETKGLLKRQVSLSDERVKCLVLSDEGKKLKEKAKSIPHNLMCKVPLSPEELNDLKLSCDNLLKALAED